MKLLILILAVLSARAGDSSLPQLENEIRKSLKEIHSLEQSHFADQAQYNTSLDGLKYSLPKALAGFVAVKLSADPSSFLLQMQGLKAPLMDKLYSIDQSGLLSGLEQFGDVHEQEAEIQQLLRSATRAMDAYFTEWGENSTDPGKIGLVIPEALKRIGQLEITLVGSSYRVDFKLASGPLKNQVLSQSGNGKVQELAAIQNRINQDLRLKEEKEAREIRVSASRDFMPGGGESRGAEGGSPLSVSVSTTDPQLDIKDIKVSMKRRFWSSKEKEKVGDSTVFRKGPYWPCGARLNIRINYFDSSKSRRASKKIPVIINCSY